MGLIDCIEKHRGHSVLWQFEWGVNWQIYPKSANFELTCHFMLCFTEGLFILHTKDLIILKTYNQSNIEQLGRCTVKNNIMTNVLKCRLFIVPGDG